MKLSGRIAVELLSELYPVKKVGVSENNTMKKPFWNLLKLSPVVFAATALSANSVLAEETKQPITSVSQIAQQTNNIGQVTSVSQFSDVQPTDWAFQALQSLVERYGCIAGYPNGTYRGNRALTRYEFAAGLNACLDRVNELIATATADLVKKEDLATLQRLQEEFSAELATLRGRVDALEARTAELEANQFSTTAKLRGEVIFNLADVFGDERAFPLGFDRDDFDGVDLGDDDAIAAQIQELSDNDLTAAQAAAYADLFNANVGDEDLDVNTVFSTRARLNFDASFFGNDRLRVRIQARNIDEFDVNNTGTDMTRLGFDGDEDNAVELDDLYYRFRLGDSIQVAIAGAASEFNDFVDVLNPAFESSGTGAISRYGRFSPIYRQGSDGAGGVVTFGLNSPFEISLGYLSPAAADSGEGEGAFNGAYGALGQVVFKPNQAIKVGFTYARSYQNQESGVDLFDGTGGILANSPFGDFATTANFYQGAVEFRLSRQLIISGWYGQAFAYAAGDEGDADLPFADGDARISYWAGSLAVQDFGGQGNTLGLIFGQPPKVIDSDFIEDEDTSYHLEALYKLRVTDNILLTPGVLIIFNPEHNNNNDTIYVGTLRTTFTF